ncbi:TPA: HAD-IC family P-type ATPase, partial [Candidatus Avacholeplasma faecigallinarum]|nr:HAD-IC family P-type ATPase [Candidatus Avacholeplasma faecigallinarum]
HPIAKSILKKVNANINSTYEAMELPGYGLVVQEENILVGNQKLMEKYNIKFKPNHGVGTVVYVAKNNEFMGSILISDQIKETTYKAISDLNSLGCNTIMLTGDNDLVAKNVKDKLNIKECYSQLLPQNKVEKLENIIKNKNKNDVVAFVGDGINDAPSLMRADIGISMGAIGSDSAIEASDVVLMYDDLNGLLVSKKIAKKTIAIVLENIVFAIFVKVLVLLLSAIGLANMWLAIVADVGVCVIAVLNAMRCIIYKDKSLKNKK